ncbi:MAG: hypothetical protein D4R48_01895 [Nitrosomonadales bacterium]|nr:MAG: hypothetical protein D4R48_01895 [Nitrosomonadales bacterium]
MRYVQSLPPLVEPSPDSGEVRAAAALKAAHPIGPRTLPPIIYRHHQLPVALPATSRRWIPRATAQEGDRRKQCRRLLHEPVLEDLRAHLDRRRHNQRKTDLATHVDEQA